MAIDLYQATVPQFLQVLGGLRGALAKAADHAGGSADELLEARLIDDMFPLNFQLLRVADHSAGALRDVSQGRFTMPPQTQLTFAAAQALLAETEDALKGWSPEAVNALAERDVVFDPGAMRMDFKGAAFLLSFSLPNFFFHAVTAYDILRMKGVPIGKRDFLGQLRLTL
jgi:hypothetical protein